jgi:MoxR-like ATPase
VLGAKVNAILHGRYHVSGEDLGAVAPAALRHRILLGFEAGTSAVTEDEIIAGILDAYLP